MRRHLGKRYAVLRQEATTVGKGLWCILSEQWGVTKGSLSKGEEEGGCQ